MTGVPDVGVGTTGAGVMAGANVATGTMTVGVVVMAGTKVATGTMTGDGMDGEGIIIGAIVVPIGIDTGAGASTGPATIGEIIGTIEDGVGMAIGTFSGAFVGNNGMIVGKMTTGGVPDGAHVGTLLLIPPPLPLLFPPPLPDFDFIFAVPVEL